MNTLLKDYVETVAGAPVTEQDAHDFVVGLEDFQRTHVDYDILEDGFLVEKTSVFDTLSQAMAFIRKVRSFSRPVIR